MESGRNIIIIKKLCNTICLPAQVKKKSDSDQLHEWDQIIFT